MPKRPRRKTPRHFVLLSAVAERGNAIDDEGHAADAVVKLTIRGRWTHGQDQTLALLIPGDAVKPLGELLIKAAPPPPAPESEEPAATPVP